VPHTATVRTVEDFVPAFAAALASGDLATLVAKVDAVGPKGSSPISRCSRTASSSSGISRASSGRGAPDHDGVEQLAARSKRRDPRDRPDAAIGT
jgi:hypothetical protein